MNNRTLIDDIEVTISVELGKNKISIKELIKLMPGSIVNLDSLSQKPLKFYANGKLMGLCEIVVVNNKYGFRITEIYTKKR